MPKTLSLKTWVKREVKLKGACYIAIMPYGEDGSGYELEIEENEGSIHASYSTGTDNLKEARKLADQLEKELTAKGIKVFKTRQKWEKSFSPIPRNSECEYCGQHCFEDGGQGCDEAQAGGFKD
jgi:hypothetical protein